MTPTDLQDAIVQALKEQLAPLRLKNSAGHEVGVKVFPQFKPYRTPRPAPTTNDDDLPEPYVLVALVNGEQTAIDSPNKVDVVIAVEVCDPDPNRQGYRDASHILNVILGYFERKVKIARAFELVRPIKWDNDLDPNKHPYYSAAIGLHFEGPTIYREEPET